MADPTDPSIDDAAWAPPRPPTPDAGSLLPGYRDFVLVARGGDSVVYRAHQDALDRDVAVKVVLLDDAESIARFQRELAITVRLGRQHPNIMTVLATGTTTEGQPCLVMDYVELGSLHNRLAERGPLPVSEVVSAGSVVADALAFAHGQGVLHRDVKPQNVLVLPTSYVLADFGLARAIDAGHSSSLERFSYRHASPQILDGEAPMVADDVYSLGSTLFTLLDGRPPFAAADPDEDSALSYLRRARTEAPRRLERADVPARLVEVVMRCLARVRTDRFASAAELRAALDAIPTESRSWAPALEPTPSSSTVAVAAPVEPAEPAEPVLTEPVLTEPVPVEPVPEQPVPEQPVPVEPVPEQPEPVVPDRPAGSSGRHAAGARTEPAANERPAAETSERASGPPELAAAAPDAEPPATVPAPSVSARSAPDAAGPRADVAPVPSDAVAVSALAHLDAPAAVARDAESTGVRPAEVPPAPPVADPGSNRRWFVIAAAAVVALAAGVFIGIYRSGGSGHAGPAPSLHTTTAPLGAPIPTISVAFPGPDASAVINPAMKPVITTMTRHGSDLQLRWTDPSDGRYTFVVFLVNGTTLKGLLTLKAGVTSATVAGFPAGRHCLLVATVGSDSQGGISWGPGPQSCIT